LSIRYSYTKVEVNLSISPTDRDKLKAQNFCPSIPPKREQGGIVFAPFLLPLPIRNRHL